MRAFVIVIVILFASSNSYSQEWANAYNMAQQQYANDNIVEALTQAKKSLELYQSQDGTLSGNYEKILRLLANLSYISAEYESGVDYIDKELTVKGNNGNINNLDHAEALYTKGLIFQALSKPNEAKSIFNQALDIYSQFYGDDEDAVIETKWQIANLDYLSGSESAALDIYDQTIHKYDISDGFTNDYIQAAFNYIELSLNQYPEKAAPYVDLLEDLYGQLEADYELALMKSNKGYIAHKRGKYEEAELYYSESESLLSSIDETGSSAYYNLANLRAVNYEKLGQSDKATAQLAIAGKNTSSASRSITLVNQANLLLQQGRFDEAIEILVNAMESIDSKDINTRFSTAMSLSRAYLLTGQLDNSSQILHESSSMENVIDDQQLLAEYYLLSGEISAISGEFNEALKHYQKAAELAENGSVIYNNTMAGKGQLLLNTGNYVGAERLFKQHLEILTGNNQQESISYAISLSNLGIARQNQAKFLEAQTDLAAAAQIAKNISGEESEIYAGINENLSIVITQLGRYTEAEALINKSIEIREKISGTTSPQYASGLQNLGRIKQLRGKYQDAEPLFTRAMQIKKETLGEQHPEYANALNSTALFYQTMGNYDRALPLFKESMEIIENTMGTEHPEYATALENIATLYVLEGKKTDALVYLEKALMIDQKIYGETHPVYATTLHNLASVYKDLDQTEKAREMYNRALTIDREVYGEKHRAYAGTLYNLAVLDQQLTQYDDAEKHFKESLAIRKEILGSNHPEYTYSLYGLAGLYHGTQKLELAKPYYEEVIKNYLKQIEDFFPSLSENEKGAFYAKIRPVIESYQDYCIEYVMSDLPNEQEAINNLFDLQLKTKALLLHSSNKVKNGIFGSGNDELIAKYTKWIEMKDQLSKYLAYSQEDLTKQNIDIAQIQIDINELEKTISKESALFDELDEEELSWQLVKGALQANQAAMEIIRIKRRFRKDEVIYAALILKSDSDNGPELTLLKDGDALEKKYYNYYRNAIKFTVGDTISYNHFWKPIDEQLAGAQQVFASADGIYNKININTLFDFDESDYVIDEYIVRNISNTKEIAKKALATTTATHDADLFGFPDYNLNDGNTISARVSELRASEFGFKGGTIPDLPGTKAEIDQLSTILDTASWNARTYVRESANETKLKAISQPKLLHIATHGFFKSDVVFDEDEASSYSNIEMNPLFRSGLLLAGSAGSSITNNLDSEDGVLTAYEAMNLNLEGTDLVVLSACETGSGEVKNGEGVYGLQRSFQVAGAKSIIMSLWQVDDNTTQELMINFYTHWLSGLDKFEAFKQAQLQLKEEHPDPFHWGAFIIIGTD